MNTPDFTAAAGFVAASARVLDQRRFQRLFEDGPAAPVRDAVAAYRNEDGGFGHALEPDGRAPDSQAAAVEMALRIMNETDAWDEDLVRGACDWLAALAPAEGGAAFVEPGEVVTHYDRGGIGTTGAPPEHLPQMPAFHLVTPDHNDVTMINIGTGPSNAHTSPTTSR